MWWLWGDTIWCLGKYSHFPKYETFSGGVYRAKSHILEKSSMYDHFMAKFWTKNSNTLESDCISIRVPICYFVYWIESVLYFTLSPACKLFLYPVRTLCISILISLPICWLKLYTYLSRLNALHVPLGAVTAAYPILTSFLMKKQFIIVNDVSHLPKLNASNRLNKW